MPAHKALQGVEIKDAAKGEVRAIFATLNVKDSDGDVTIEGAFKEGQEVVVSAYGHQSWMGALPVGKGQIHANKKEAWADLQFFMNTDHGKATFETVKELGPLGQWSYGFDVLDSEAGTKDGENVNFLKSLDVFEVSPVLRGAGVNTRTVSAKSAEAKQLNSEVQSRLRDAGRERWGSANTYVWLDDFDVDQNWAVFCIEGAGKLPSRFVQVAFTRTADSVELGETEQEVIRTAAYAPKAADPSTVKHEETGVFKALPHHNDDGTVDIAACSKAVALLNDARNPISDPEERKQAFTHLAEHLRDNDIEPPALLDTPASGMKLSDQLHAAVAVVAVARERAAVTHEQRKQQNGKSLGNHTLQLLDAVEAEMKNLREVLTSAGHAMANSQSAELASLEADFERMSAGLNS